MSLRLGSSNATQPSPVQVLIPGTAAVSTNAVPPGIRMASAAIIDTLVLRAGTVPTGAGLTVLVRNNGTAVQGISLAAGAGTSTLAGLGASVAAGDVLTFDITGVGSTVAGADLALDLIPSRSATADTPLGLTGIVGRWRADSLLGSVADGALVSSLPDRSGFARTLTGAGAVRPTFVASALNGHAALRFNNTGAAKYLTALGFTVAQPFTQVIVAKSVDVSKDNCLIGAYTTAQADTKIAFTRVTLNAPTTASANPVLSNATWYGIYAGFSGAASIQRVYPVSTQVTISPGTNAMNGVTLGNNEFQSSVEGDFQIAEAFVFDHILTGTEQTTMNTYLNTRYGL